MFSFRVVRDGVGRRTLLLNELMWEGKVSYVDEFELWVLPRIGLSEQRLVMVGYLKDGEAVVFETTAVLFERACRDVHRR